VGLSLAQLCSIGSRILPPEARGKDTSYCKPNQGRGTQGREGIAKGGWGRKREDGKKGEICGA
jgi:hypothetical protein